MRHELYRSGKKIELLACFEPSFRFMAEWWKQLYGESEGKEGKGLFPASVDFTADLHSMGQYIQQGERTLLETVVRFAADPDQLTVPHDDVMDLAREIIRCDALNRVHVGLDYFDATINRIGAYVIGSRAAQKLMLRALLEPRAEISRLELAGEGYKVLALIEEQKAMPWQAVYDEFCVRNDVPVGQEFIADIDKYTAEVISKR